MPVGGDVTALCVAALNYAAVRMFLRGEREGVALEGELATAREIQRCCRNSRYFAASYPST